MMDLNGVSFNGDIENPQNNNESLNRNEMTTNEKKSSSTSPSSLIIDDVKEMVDDKIQAKDNSENCDKKDENNTDREEEVNFNITESIVFNSTNKTKCDGTLSTVIEPMKKKHKKYENSSDEEKIDNNMKPSCSTPYIDKCEKNNTIHILDKRLSENSGNDRDVETSEDLIVASMEVSGTNSADQSTSHLYPEPEVTRNSSIDNEDSAQSDRDEQAENQPNSNNNSEKADDSSEWTTASEDELESGFPAVLKKKKPSPKWFVLPEILNRQIGKNNNLDRNFHGSLHAVQRMKLLHKMDAHEGCVNALCFNENGRYIASGSDDLKVIVWDWARNKYINIFKTGHRLNIFSVKWLPVDSESLIATCSRDGQVRLIDTRTSTNRRLTSHSKKARSLAIHPDHAHGILSAGDDGRVISIDIRVEKPTRLITVKDRSSHVPLYSIHINPRNINEFCVGGRSISVKIYDRRRILEPIHKLCPHNLRQNSSAHVTSTVYNYNGTEVLASYSDDDIYLFDTALPHPNGDYAHHYEGHRNSDTIKGVNFFGPKSEFIVSGSNCANIFIWEKNTEAIVQWMFGDNTGVVNCLESHPHAPILATSGLDSDVKMWVPSNDAEPTMPNLESCIKTNIANRFADGMQPDVFDSRMLSVFFQHIRQYGLYRSQPGLRDRILHSYLNDDFSESSNDSSNDSASSSNNNNGDDSSLDDDGQGSGCITS